MKRKAMLVFLVVTAGAVLAETVHVGLPSWTIERSHSISHIQVRREHLGTITIPSYIRDLSDPVKINQLAEHFSTFTGSEELMRASALTEPLFTLVVTHSNGTNELTVTVERGMLSRQGQTNPVPCASVYLWEKRPDGVFQEWGHHTYAPVKTNEVPATIAVLDALFQDRRTIKDGEPQGGGYSPPAARSAQPTP